VDRVGEAFDKDRPQRGRHIDPREQFGEFVFYRHKWNGER
jgi:hypothetical protein